MRVPEARRILIDEELRKLVDMDDVVNEALDRVENHGIVFIDELDKIAGERGTVGPDVSREGVQRDLLPIVEGSTVQTRYGLVRTDHVLFIAAGAFHVSKPSDLIPELQGRFPIRVELLPLTEEDFVRIMTEPENALTKQYAALCAAGGRHARVHRRGDRRGGAHRRRSLTSAWRTSGPAACTPCSRPCSRTRSTTCPTCPTSTSSSTARA